MPDAILTEVRGWKRGVSPLIAVPLQWVDPEPYEIANGLLRMLFGAMQLDSAYARFADRDEGSPVVVWRPSGPLPPVVLEHILQADEIDGYTPVVAESFPGEDMRSSVVTLSLAKHCESSIVVVAARRRNFPTVAEAQFLRDAVWQAAIAVHSARRLELESAARRAAEEALFRQQELLRSLADEVAPELAALARTVRSAGRSALETGRRRKAGRTGAGQLNAPKPDGPHWDSGLAGGDLPSLSNRELEVLGLLAQGLSNKEIAGVLWLSDRTIERHVTSLYRKIGVARRSEATAFAFRHGVV